MPDTPKPAKADNSEALRKLRERNVLSEADRISIAAEKRVRGIR